MSEPESAGAVEEFLQLEAELSSGTKRAETYDQGNIAGVAKIPAEEVPDDYPVSIDTREALHLDVETPDGETVATYIEWPAEDEESDHVERLLDALGRSHDEFANVYGDRIALETEDGWHGIDPERTKLLRDASEANTGEWVERCRRRLGATVLAGALGPILVATVAPSLGTILFLASMVAIPGLFYRDARRLSETTTWTNNWQLLLLSVTPLLNVGFGAAYLLNRHLYLSGDSLSKTRRVVRNALVAGAVTFVVAFLLVDSAPNVGSPTLLYAWTFMTLGVYFDTHYASGLRNQNAKNSYGVLLTALLGPVGAVWYALKESKTLS